MEEQLQDCTVGTSGHTIAFGSTTITEGEKNSIHTVCGCPINRNVPLRISRSAFVRTCKAFQKRAGVQTRRCTQSEKHTKHSSLTAHGFRGNNVFICASCVTGSMIRNNRVFAPPNKYIEFTEELTRTVQKKNKAPKKQATQKLTSKDVKRIRCMYQEGYSIISILTVFSKVSRTAISDVVNRKTWKNIT